MPATDPFAPRSFRYAEDGGVAAITFTRPDTLNSLTFDVYAELRDLFAAMRTRESVKAVTITGEGKGFCSGGNVHDIIGNLREWTGSQYRPYPYRKDDGREAPDPKATRVVRGASHDDGPDGLRVTIRRYYEHSGTARGHHHVGFRCSR